MYFYEINHYFQWAYMHCYYIYSNSSLIFKLLGNFTNLARFLKSKSVIIRLCMVWKVQQYSNWLSFYFPDLTGRPHKPYCHHRLLRHWPIQSPLNSDRKKSWSCDAYFILFLLVLTSLINISLLYFSWFVY